MTARASLPVLVGIAVLVAAAIAHTGEIRDRAEAGLGEGMPAREAALARGFVLGDDDGVDEATKEDFIRSGLSHLLAVSGENVTLLALLAMPVLAVFGIPLRERLVWAIALIAIYVPLAGSGPSIQRAGVMGAAGLLATLAGRRTSRLYGLALAGLVTVAVDPGVAGNVGWQLSFAAVLGILLLASPIRDRLLARMTRGRRLSRPGRDDSARGRHRPEAKVGSWRRALAEGIAVTVAATLATAPLIAHVFEEVSLTSLAANVLALPAVAPAMWLGMVSAALAQVPGVPLAPLNGLDALLLAYIAQVAAWCGRPSWAILHVHIGLWAMLATYATMAATIVAGSRLARARRLAAARSRASAPAAPTAVAAPRALRACAAAALAALLAATGLVLWPRGSGPPAAPTPGLRIEVLDVGQGDAILLRPRRAPAILVDGGPPGDELVAKLHQEGVGALGAAVVTHDQSDHAAGVAEALGRVPIDRFLYGRLDGEFLTAARADGARPEQVATGTTLRSGSLRLEVLWPPPELLAEDPPDTDPNLLALVIRARWHHFTMLLTADAEAESTPLDPGPIDVLKVAHHGSDDAGLGPLLDRIRPRLAVISVGAHNPYGHPTAGTLATLARHGVPTLRTDLDGTVEIDVSRRSFSVH
ncbi:MAG: ComEC/Rec2 family competence protein [Actinobacteria bacterium]|nr:ComEC/Rec2 family competence protein [Actinomycetota bacterium]